MLASLVSVTVALICIFHLCVRFYGFCEKPFYFHLVMMTSMLNLVISCDQAIEDEAHTWPCVPRLQTEGVTEQSVWQASLQT